jgi:hypothetical protein
LNKPIKASYVLILAIVTLLSVGLTNPVFGGIPVIQNVVVYDVGGSIYLDITVVHSPEILAHHVDKIQVTFGTNTTEKLIDVQSSTTFTITYVVGPVADIPTATVKSHCNVDGWSIQDWAGLITEFPNSLLLLAFLLIISVSVIALCRTMLKPCK